MAIEDQILKLRLQILSLGEKRNWWNSSFFTEDSHAFLDYVFPKTSYAASVVAAMEVGKEIHDKMIGIGKFHLFRLPQAMEEKIHRLIFQSEALADWIKATNGKEMETLEAMSEYMAISNEQGPIHIGTLADLNDEDIIPVLAKHYHDAFKEDYQTYPYLK